MTNIPPSPSPDDSLDRAAAALRRTSVPEGPAEETIARTLAALRSAETATVPFYRRKPMRYIWKIAVAGLLAVGVAVYLTGILSPRPPLAFAEVAAKLRDTRTLTYKVTIKIPKSNKTITTKVFFKEPGRMRSEGEGQVSIADQKQNKILLLVSKTKTAMLIEYKKGKNAEEGGNIFATIERLRKLAGKTSESVGKKQIGDIEVEGFRTEEEGVKLTVWADPKSRLPILIEMPIRAEDGEMFMTIGDFQFDPKLDDDLFPLEPPEGYQLRKMVVEEGKPEDRVINLLRAYASKFDGRFPAAMSVANADWQAYFNKLGNDKKAKGPPDAEVMRWAEQVVRVNMLLLRKKDSGYKPNSVKLGDRDKIIFWYRPDKAEEYRAVYGDLHVADVTADQLPEKPKK